MSTRQVNECASDEEKFYATDLTDAVTLEQEKKLLRKLDWKILPLTCSLYLLACTSS